MLLLQLHLNLLLVVFAVVVVVVAGAVVGSGLVFAIVIAVGSRLMVAVPGFVVVLVVPVALVALTLLPLGLQSSSHVHAWRVGVTAGGILAVVNRMLLRAVLVSSSPRLAALVVPFS